MPPLTQERQGYGLDQRGPYDQSGRGRPGQPSSPENRYGRSSVSRGQPRYDDEYAGEYGGDPYDDRQNASGRGYGRRVGPDARGDYPQDDPHARSWQQRWGDTISGMRIPGMRPSDDESGGGKSSSRRMVTTVVLLLVLLAVIVAGVVVVRPKVMARLHPQAQTSSLCASSGSATVGPLPTPPAHFKQFTSSRSRYGVIYPETWTVEPQQKAASGYDYIDVYTLPNTATLVNIEQPEAACALTDINIIQGEVAVAQRQNITFAEDTAAARAQAIGGEQWQRREYDVTDSGVSLHMVILACHHQGRAYVIVLVSKTTTFTSDDTNIFEPMLKSFAFTN